MDVRYCGSRARECYLFIDNKEILIECDLHVLQVKMVARHDASSVKLVGIYASLSEEDLRNEAVSMCWTPDGPHLYA